MPAQNIYNALQPRSVEDYDNQAVHAQAGRMGLMQNALALQSGQMQMQDRQRALQEQDTVRNALTGLGANATDEQRIQALKGTATPTGFTQADALQKALLERAKADSEAKYKTAQTGELTQKTEQEKIKFGLQGLAAANDPRSAAMVGLQSGLVPPEKAQEYFASIPKDPQGFAQWKQQQMLRGVDLAKQFDIAEAQARDAETARHNKSAEGIQVRGQDMVNARSREATAASRDATAAALTKPFEVTRADGTSALAQMDKKGNLVEVQGYGPKAGSKPLNEGQAKALGFGTRMQEADKALQALEGKYSPGAISAKTTAEAVGGFTGALAGPLGNVSMSDETQQAEQAQRDFINAILRRESGAAIAPSEFENARKQYFPQPLDKPGNLAQKARNRQLAIQGVLAEVPPALRGSITPPASAPAAAAPAPSGGASGGWSYIGPVPATK